MSSTLDALIVGAGPVGLTMATELLRHGLTCRIVDKCPSATDKSKALVLWTRTLELFEKAGLAERFVQSGMLLDGASIYADGERKIHLEMHAPQTHYPRPVMIPQSKTEAILAAHLLEQGLNVERSVALQDFEEANDHVRATLLLPTGKTESVTASWLIGCDGAHSTVRHGIGYEFVGEPEPNDWILADVHIEGPIAPTEISIYWHAKGILVFFPFEPGRYRVIADQGFAKALAKPLDPTLEQVQAMVDQRGPAGLKLYDPIWLAGFRIQERKVANYRAGRVFLAGDAAHIHSPAGGQGMNTGMQDAMNLAWKLALVQQGHGNAEILLSSYSQERSAVGDTVLKQAGAMTRAATLRNPVAQFVRNHTASVLGSLSCFRNRITNNLTELAISYPHSILNGEHRGFANFAWLIGGLKPGDRLPDADITATSDGQSRRLLEILHGTTHHLLLLGAETQSQAAELAEMATAIRERYGDLVKTHWLSKSLKISGEISAAFDNCWNDTSGIVHEQHAIHDPSLILVRPDGYIAYRSQPADQKLLLTHLATYLNVCEHATV
ncbi:MAG: FAD-dependent monooxygenase [Planctomycetota bacterium]|nr:FAD-dependent monooxygenase [Planctomycetota bacterium]